jgi:hypothetical protein
MATERPPIMVQRRGDFLIPEAPTDGERIRRLPAGKALKAVVTQPRRSNPQLRLYFSLLDVVAENLDQDVTGDDLHEWMKLRLGLCVPIKTRSGRVNYVPKSVAFDKMEHDEFTAYFAQVKALVVEDLIPGLNSDALEREARAMLGEAA